MTCHRICLLRSQVGPLEGHVIADFGQFDAIYDHFPVAILLIGRLINLERCFNKEDADHKVITFVGFDGAVDRSRRASKSFVINSSPLRDNEGHFSALPAAHIIRFIWRNGQTAAPSQGRDNEECD